MNLKINFLKINFLRLVMTGTLLIVFFHKVLSGVLNTKIFNVVDEVFILLVLILLIIHGLYTKTIEVIFLSTLLIVLYFIIISVLFGKQSDVFMVIMQSVIHLKFFIFLSFFYLIINKLKIINGITILKYFLIISLLGLLLEVIFHNTFYNFMNIDFNLRPYAKRDKVVYGGFIKTNVLSFLLIVYFTLKAFLDKTFSGKKFFTWLILLLFFFILVRSRTPILVLLGLVFLKYRTKIFKFRVMTSFVMVFVAALFFIKTQTILIEKTTTNISLMFTKDSHYIRGIMYFLSGQIFVDYFPIGTGAATFGTVLSENSITYSIYNVSRRSFFINMDGVYDSNMASIIGEFGFIGVIIFVCLFSLLFLKNSKKGKVTTALIAMLFITFIYCFVSPLFMNTFFSMVLALGFSVLYFYKDEFV